MHAADRLICQGLPLKPDGGNGCGVQHFSHVGKSRLSQDQHPGYLDAAAGGPGAGSHKHQHH